MMAVNGSGLSCDLSQPEKPSPTTPFVHQPPPHLAQECQETSPPQDKVRERGCEVLGSPHLLNPSGSFFFFPLGL